MKHKKFHRFAFILCLFLAVSSSHECQAKERQTLYQVSVLSGLLKGDYDGKVSLRVIRSRGDFGIGTFDRLDGEEIELEGVFYRVAADGTVARMDDRVSSPFAMATFFDAKLRFAASGQADYQSLQSLIDSRLPTANIPFAIRVDGHFSSIKARSVPAQNKPYAPFADVVKSQSVFEFRDIEGTLVGFRMPIYAQGVNMPGYHLHFLSRDRTKGGHVLECAVGTARVSVDTVDKLEMAIPASTGFNTIDFASDISEALAGEKSK